jgi:hypothetical protein
MLSEDRDHGVAFVDIETTGLYPWAGAAPWEVALIVQEPDVAPYSGREATYPWREYVWHLPVNLGLADPMALKIGRYHERYGKEVEDITDADDFADEFAALTHGRHLAGAVVSFDAGFLDPYLRQFGACPTWHYHLIDVEALAVGYLAAQEVHQAPLSLPWDSSALTATLGLNIPDEWKHTALGDARWAKAMYEAVVAPGPG